MRPGSSLSARLLLMMAAIALIATSSCRGCDPAPTTPPGPTPPAADTPDAGSPTAGAPDAGSTSKVTREEGSTPEEIPVRRFVAEIRTDGPPGPCPAPPETKPPTWKVTALLAQVPDELGLVGADPGRQYCTYEWLGAPTSAKELEAMLPATVKAEADPPVITGLSLESAKEKLREITLHQNRGVVLGGAKGPAAPVVVVLVDSAPRKADQPVGSLTLGRSLHGTTVGLVIHQIACPDVEVGSPACPVKLSPQLALNAVIDGDSVKEDAAGGYVGTLSSVSQAIWQGVLDFGAYRKQNPGARLVINLSIGWDPAMVPGGTSGTGDSAGMAAVLASLRFAEKNGALILAAAGNRSGGPTESDGPMYPGRWEASEKAASCTPTNQGECGPLLYAVGGVDDAGRPLASARPGGMPRLVANGLQVTVSPAQLGGAGPFPALTGSSMATAAVSGAAAAVLASNPALAGEDVIALLYKAGTSTALTADFCPGNLTGCKAPVRWLGPGGSIQAPLSFATAPSRASVFEELAGIPADETFGVAVAELVATDAPSCGDDYRVLAPAGETPADTCAQVQSYRAPRAILVHPQPDSPGCDVCSIIAGEGATRKLWYQANGALKVSQLVVTSLVLYDSVKRTSSTVKLGDRGVAPGRLLVIDKLDLSSFTFDRAEVIATFDSNGARGVIVDQLSF